MGTSAPVNELGSSLVGTIALSPSRPRPPTSRGLDRAEFARLLSPPEEEPSPPANARYQRIANEIAQRLSPDSEDGRIDVRRTVLFHLDRAERESPGNELAITLALLNGLQTTPGLLASTRTPSDEHYITHEEIRTILRNNP